MFYTVIDIAIVSDRIALVFVASDEVDLIEDPNAVDCIWCVDKATVDKMAVGDYIKKPDSVRWECTP